MRDTICNFGVTESMIYSVTSHAYLERMKARMNEGTDEALFYAALELRCGVEARMREYVEAIDGIPESEKKQWHVAKLGRSLETAYRTGDKVMNFVFTSEKTAARCDFLTCR